MRTETIAEATPTEVLGDARNAPGRRLLGLTWAHLLNDGSANYLPGVLPAVLIAVHQPVRMAGVLVASLTIGQVLQPALGRVADRVGGRWLVVLGLFLSSAGGALLGVTHSLGVLIALLLIIGLGSALFHPQALAGVRSLLQGRRGLLTSVFLIGGELGRGIWPTAASLVAAHLGLQYLWIIAIPGLVTAGLLLRWAPDLPAQPRNTAAVRWGEHRRPLALLLGYSGTRALTIFGLVTFLPILWHVRGGSLVSGASIITTAIAGGVVGNLAGGHLADRFGRRPVLVISALATTLLILPVAYLQGPAVWLAAALLGSAMFLSASPAVLVGQDIFSESRSMGSGIALGLANGIGALLVLFLGLLITDSTVIDIFWVLAACSAASILAALAFSRSLMQ